MESNILTVTSVKSVPKIGKLKKTADILEKLMNGVFTLCGFIAVAFVLIITIFLIISGVPAIKEIGVFKFLFGTVWASTTAEPSYGILTFILSSVYGTFGATNTPKTKRRCGLSSLRRKLLREYPPSFTGLWECWFLCSSAA